MNAAVVIDGRCTACGVCIVTCPERALVPAPRRPAVLHLRCTACWACIEVCPVGAIAEGPGSPVCPGSREVVA